MIRSTHLIVYSILMIAMLSCKNKQSEYDATGTFEATEVIVSAEASGKIEQFQLQEGDFLDTDQAVGYIDTVQLHLRKLQLLQTQRVSKTRQPDVSLQIAAIKEQIAKARIEKARIEQLLIAKAANTKQLDDVVSQIAVLEKSLAAQVNSLNTNINSLNAEADVVDIQVAQINDQLQKCRIINPLSGRVLTKYMQEKELVVQGKPLYKIADIKHLFLRAYLIAPQLANVSIGQDVQVVVHNGDEPSVYEGRVSWISDQAEFTPKSIQTKDERQNLVYAIKVAVENPDGLLKIGMYADLTIHD